MATKTPLRELQQAVVCAIATDTYQGYQEDTSQLTTWAILEVHAAWQIKFAHARITKIHTDFPYLSPSLRNWCLHVLLYYK